MTTLSIKNIAIIGSGGREYAIGLKLINDKKENKNNLEKLFFIPGNGKTSDLGENIILKENEDIVEFCKNKNIDFVIIGPEDPLINGLGDDLRDANIKVFGPSQKAAQLEGSKAFMKDFISKVGIKTAKYLNTSDLKEAQNFIDSLPLPIVLKADGLCAGKGVLIINTHKSAKEEVAKMLSGESFGKAGKNVVIEEYLDGYELSVFGISNGSEFTLLPACQDHKRLKDGDNGPNTGGMGAYSPTPLSNANLMEKIKNEIFAPTISALKNENMPFVGVLFAGIMVVDKNGILEPYLLEYNVRFGDPECEVLMPLLDSGLIELLNCESKEAKLKNGYCVGVVAASKDYPYKSSEPQEIKINADKLKALSSKGHIVYAGVEQKDSKLYATGGRVLLGIGKGESIQEAKANAYEILKCVDFEGMQYRIDIADRALK